MRGLGVVYLKELRDALRDRRSVLTALLFAPLGMPLMSGGAIYLMVEERWQEATAPLSVPVVGGAAAPHLMAQLEADGIEPDLDAYADRAGLAAAVKAGQVDAGVVIAEDFGAALQSGAPARVWVLHDSSQATAAVPSMRLKGIINDYGRTLGGGRLLLRGVNPALARPITTLEQDLSTPQGRSILLFGVMTYFLLFVTFMGGSQVAVDTTVGERERGSLEPLLAMPVSGGALVAGKLFATTTFMVIALAVCVATFAVATRWLPLAEAGMTANMGLANSVGIWLVVAPFALLAASVIKLVASFAKTTKEAWTYSSLCVLVPTLPIIYLQIKPMQASLPAMLVPSLSQHLLTTALVKGEDLVPTHVLASVVSTAAIAAVLGAVAASRYRRGRLLS